MGGTEKTRDSGEANEHVEMTQCQIIKNVLVVSLGFLFLFTAFQSTSNLQSSLNSDAGLGTGGLATVYAALVVSCLFTPPFIIDHVGCKWTVAFSMLCYILYMVANFYPVWGTIIPGAIILGIGAAPLWSAKCTYLTQVGSWYSKLTGTTEDDIINRFFGIFFMIFQTSQIWGNLTSSLIFAEPESNNNTTTNGSGSVLHCGANDCPATDSSSNNTNLKNPDTTKIYTVFGIYLACALVGFGIIALFLDPIQLDKDVDKKKRTNLSFHLVLETAKHIWRNPYQKLLVTLTIYSGIEQAFITGDFTRSYITCALGVSNVGYIMIVYGVVDAACSFVFGRLVQHVGHIPFFILAFAVHLGCQIALVQWTPEPDRLYLFYILAALWGLGDAVIQTQINALYGYLFSDNPEAAFANYRLWESVGFFCAFGYSFYLCTAVKLYICMGVLIAGMIQYGIVEFVHRRQTKHSLDITQS